MPTSSSTAPRDKNSKPVLMGVASQTITINGVAFIQDVTPVPIAVDPVTGEVQIETI